MADAIDNEWVDGRSGIDIFVKKNNGVGYTYDDLILMPGASRAIYTLRATRRHAARRAMWPLSLLLLGLLGLIRSDNFDVEVA